jgi:hypothetical protein
MKIGERALCRSRRVPVCLILPHDILTPTFGRNTLSGGGITIELAQRKPVISEA